MHSRERQGKIDTQSVGIGRGSVSVLIWVPQDGGGGYAAGGGGAEGGGGGGEGFEFGVDANMDPELAMALRVSLEEERARQGAAGAQLQTVRAHVLRTLLLRVYMLEDV